jgi:peptidoglycan/xylan/chitin deacetylase (PgdA/CDA1 family)
MNPKKHLISVGFYPLMALCLLAACPLSTTAAEPGIIWGGPAEVKQVALTFDDGPSPRCTAKILALLKQYQAHGTFFVLGAHVERYPWLVQAAVRDGNEVGNHSFAHPRLTKSDELSRERELERTALELELLGYHPKHLLFRPPFSAYDDRLLAYLAHTHRRMVLWGIDSGDWRGLPAADIVHNVLDRVRPGAIIIFHDCDEKDQTDRGPTVEALKVILPALKAAGYRMVTISELVAGEDATQRSSSQSEPLPKQPVKPRFAPGAKKNIPVGYDNTGPHPGDDVL